MCFDGVRSEVDLIIMNAKSNSIYLLPGKPIKMVSAKYEFDLKSDYLIGWKPLDQREGRNQ